MRLRADRVVDTTNNGGSGSGSANRLYRAFKLRHVPGSRMLVLCKTVFAQMGRIDFEYMHSTLVVVNSVQHKTHCDESKAELNLLRFYLR